MGDLKASYWQTEQLRSSVRRILEEGDIDSRSSLI